MFDYIYSLISQDFLAVVQDIKSHMHGCEFPLMLFSKLISATVHEDGYEVSIQLNYIQVSNKVSKTFRICSFEN